MTVGRKELAINAPYLGPDIIRKEPNEALRLPDVLQIWIGEAFQLTTSFPQQELDSGKISFVHCRILSKLVS